jgi:hypothetical protein
MYCLVLSCALSWCVFVHCLGFFLLSSRVVINRLKLSLNVLSSCVVTHCLHAYHILPYQPLSCFIFAWLPFILLPSLMLYIREFSLIVLPSLVTCLRACLKPLFLMDCLCALSCSVSCLVFVRCHSSSYPLSNGLSSCVVINCFALSRFLSSCIALRCIALYRALPSSCSSFIITPPPPKHRLR